MLSEVATIEFGETSEKKDKIKEAQPQAPGYLTPLFYDRAVAGIPKKAKPRRQVASSELALFNRKSDWKLLLDDEIRYLKSLPDSLDDCAELHRLERLAKTHDNMDPAKIHSSTNGLVLYYSQKEFLPLDNSEMFSFRRQFQMFTKNMEAKKLSFELKHEFSQKYLRHEDKARLKFQLHTINSKQSSAPGPGLPASGAKSASEQHPESAAGERRASPKPRASSRLAPPAENRPLEEPPVNPQFFESRFTFFNPPSFKSRATGQKSAKKSDYVIKTEASTTLVDLSARPFDSQRDYERVGQLLFNRSSSNQHLEHSEDRPAPLPLGRRTLLAKAFPKKNLSQTSLTPAATKRPRHAEGWLLVKKLASK